MDAKQSIPDFELGSEVRHRASKHGLFCKRKGHGNTVPFRIERFGYPDVSASASGAGLRYLTLGTDNAKRIASP